MIESIRLEDFKGHRDNTIPLARLTLLVGPNGAGKTSVLEALSLHSHLVSNSHSMIFGPHRLPYDILRRGAPGPISLTCQGFVDGAAWRSRAEIATASIKHVWKHREGEETYDARHDLALRTDAPELFELLKAAGIYKLEPARIAEASYDDYAEPTIGQDGSNAAVVLASIKLGSDEVFARIEESLRRIIPNVERIRIRRTVVRRRVPGSFSQDQIGYMGDKVYFDFKGARDVPAHAASEGTLITLALLTVLHGPNRPNLLLLDDFAESLHPQAQMELVRLLKRMLAEIPDLQIVATTHSPYILDELDPSEIVAFALRDDGTVAQKRLSEHPQAEKMKGALSAGQLWSLDPERDWVLPPEESR
jgi:predicted ATPase